QACGRGRAHLAGIGRSDGRCFGATAVFPRVNATRDPRSDRTGLAADSAGTECPGCEPNGAVRRVLCGSPGRLRVFALPHRGRVYVGTVGGITSEWGAGTRRARGHLERLGARAPT